MNKHIMLVTTLVGLSLTSSVWAMKAVEQGSDEQTKLQVTFFENTPQNIFSNSDGYSGSVWEMFSYIAEKMGYDLEVTPKSNNRMVSDFTSGETAFLLVPEFLIEPDEGVLQSNLIICMRFGFLTKNGNQINNVEDLAGKRVAYSLAGWFIDGYIERLKNSGNSFASYKTSSEIEAIRMMAYDRVDVAFVPLISYRQIMDAGESLAGVADAAKDEFDPFSISDKMDLHFYMHPNSPIYERGAEFMSIVNEASRDGLFWDLTTEYEGDKPEDCQ